ncbi:acetyltransferase [Rhizobium altiplani]|uniref:Acetyltransferase n=1 Tax=Rhizobium altiplani TaxID=1864509 RepID=A0A109JLE1_9HYPH|nr:GNAT family N-acetyltransferase [Rhizobium altiplani]KWV51045.1 acetyltransferase [Rhizobium altiplani]
MQRAILETPRLVAVMWGPDDAGLIHELHSTIETTRYLSGTAPWSREKAEERLRNWFGEQERDGATKYKILSRDDGRFIGRAGFSLLDGERRDFELGYSLRFQEWGKGYATEIAGELAEWFFERNFAQQFIAFTHPDNAASQHVLTKIGMRSRMPMIIDGLTCPTFELTAGMRTA